MSTADDDNNLKCAACGKVDVGLKACTACKLVKYCNASCQRAHWRKHKKECKKRVAELHDEALFKQPPPRDECDICMLTLSLRNEEQQYQACCGKVLCDGCIHAAYRADNRRLCPFCRAPPSTSEGEYLKRMQKRAKGNDANSIYQLGQHYSKGEMGLEQDYGKAMELCLRAGELGDAVAHHSIACAYYNGNGVERDLKKSEYYDELAAMGGDAQARHNLGIVEENAGNIERAVKHYMISAGAGYDESLQEIRDCFMNGNATKDDFEKALRAHKEAKDEMKSDQRDAAAVFRGLR